jgi:hypothetical protein
MATPSRKRVALERAAERNGARTPILSIPGEKVKTSPGKTSRSPSAGRPVREHKKEGSLDVVPR